MLHDSNEIITTTTIAAATTTTTTTTWIYIKHTQTWRLYPCPFTAKIKSHPLGRSSYVPQTHIRKRSKAELARLFTHLHYGRLNIVHLKHPTYKRLGRAVSIMWNVDAVVCGDYSWSVFNHGIHRLSPVVTGTQNQKVENRNNDELIFGQPFSHGRFEIIPIYVDEWQTENFRITTELSGYEVVALIMIFSFNTLRMSDLPMYFSLLLKHLFFFLNNLLLLWTRSATIDMETGEHMLHARSFHEYLQKLHLP